jgi:hypothetical protein
MKRDARRFKQRLLNDFEAKFPDMPKQSQELRNIFSKRPDMSSDEAEKLTITFAKKLQAEKQWYNDMVSKHGMEKSHYFSAAIPSALDVYLSPGDYDKYLTSQEAVGVAEMDRLRKEQARGVTTSIFAEADKAMKQQPRTKETLVGQLAGEDIPEEVREEATKTGLWKAGFGAAPTGVQLERADISRLRVRAQAAIRGELSQKDVLSLIATFESRKAAAVRNFDDAGAREAESWIKALTKALPKTKGPVAPPEKAEKPQLSYEDFQAWKSTGK